MVNNQPPSTAPNISNLISSKSTSSNTVAPSTAPKINDIISSKASTTNLSPSTTNIGKDEYPSTFTPAVGANNAEVAGHLQSGWGQAGRGLLQVAPYIAAGFANLAATGERFLNHMGIGDSKLNEPALINNYDTNYNLLDKIDNSLTNYATSLNPYPSNVVSTFNFLGSSAKFIVPLITVAGEITKGVTTIAGGVSGLGGILGTDAPATGNILRDVASKLQNFSMSESGQASFAKWGSRLGTSAIWAAQTAHETRQAVAKEAFNQALLSGLSQDKANEIANQNADKASNYTFWGMLALNSTLSIATDLLPFHTETPIEKINKLSKSLSENIGSESNNTIEQQLEKLKIQQQSVNQGFVKSTLLPVVGEQIEGVAHMAGAGASQEAGTSYGLQQSSKEISKESNNKLFDPVTDGNYLSHLVTGLQKQVTTSSGLNDLASGLFLGIGMHFMGSHIMGKMHEEFDPKTGKYLKQNVVSTTEVPDIDQNTGKPIVDKDGKPVMKKVNVYKKKYYSNATLNKFQMSGAFDSAFDAVKEDLQNIADTHNKIKELNIKINSETDDNKRKNLIQERDDLQSGLSDNYLVESIINGDNKSLKVTYDSIRNLDNKKDINENKRNELKDQLDKEQDPAKKQEIQKQIDNLKPQSEAMAAGYADNMDTDATEDPTFKLNKDKAKELSDRVDKYSNIAKSYNNIMNRNNTLDGRSRVKLALGLRMEYDRISENNKKLISELPPESLANHLSNPTSKVFEHLSTLHLLQQNLNDLIILKDLPMDDKGNFDFTGREKLKSVYDRVKKFPLKSNSEKENDRDLFNNMIDENKRLINEESKKSVSELMYNSPEYDKFVEDNKLEKHSKEADDKFSEHIIKNFKKNLYNQKEIITNKIALNQLAELVDYLVNQDRQMSFINRYINNINKKIQNTYNKQDDLFKKQYFEFLNKTKKDIDEEYINIYNNCVETINQYNSNNTKVSDLIKSMSDIINTLDNFDTERTVLKKEYNNLIQTKEDILHDITKQGLTNEKQNKLDEVGREIYNKNEEIKSLDSKKTSALERLKILNKTYDILGKDILDIYKTYEEVSDKINDVINSINISNRLIDENNKKRDYWNELHKNIYEFDPAKKFDMNSKTEEPIKPTEPTETNKPTEPTETNKPTEPTETNKPTEPTETNKPTEPTENVDPIEEAQEKLNQTKLEAQKQAEELKRKMKEIHALNTQIVENRLAIHNAINTIANTFDKNKLNDFDKFFNEFEERKNKISSIQEFIKEAQKGKVVDIPDSIKDHKKELNAIVEGIAKEKELVQKIKEENKEFKELEPIKLTNDELFIRSEFDKDLYSTFNTLLQDSISNNYTLPPELIKNYKKHLEDNLPVEINRDIIKLISAERQVQLNREYAFRNDSLATNKRLYNNAIETLRRHIIGLHDIIKNVDEFNEWYKKYEKLKNDLNNKEQTFKDELSNSKLLEKINNISTIISYEQTIDEKNKNQKQNKLMVDIINNKYKPEKITFRIPTEEEFKSYKDSKSVAYSDYFEENGDGIYIKKDLPDNKIPNLPIIMEIENENGEKITDFFDTSSYIFRTSAYKREAVAFNMGIRRTIKEKLSADKKGKSVSFTVNDVVTHTNANKHVKDPLDKDGRFISQNYASGIAGLKYKNTDANKNFVWAKHDNVNDGKPLLLHVPNYNGEEITYSEKGFSAGDKKIAVVIPYDINKNAKKIEGKEKDIIKELSSNAHNLSENPVIPDEAFKKFNGLQENIVSKVMPQKITINEVEHTTVLDNPVIRFENIPIDIVKPESYGVNNTDYEISYTKDNIENIENDLIDVYKNIKSIKRITNVELNKLNKLANNLITIYNDLISDPNLSDIKFNLQEELRKDKLIDC